MATKEENLKGKHYIAVISAYTIFGFFSLPLRAIETYASLDILLSRLWMASGVMIIVSLTFRRKKTLESLAFFRRADKKLKRKLLAINALSALMLAANWYLFIYVMNEISVNATALAYMLCPILNTVLAFVFLKDRLKPIQWFAILLAFSSCFLLSLGNFSETVYAFLVGLSYAIYLVLQKNNDQLDRFFLLAFQIICATLLLLPAYAIQNGIPQKGIFYYEIIFVIAVLFTIIPMYLNVYALDGLSSSTAGIFVYLNPIISFVLALFYFREKIESIKIISYSVVFFSVILFNVPVLRRIFGRKSDSTPEVG